jgi:hypothetical protein
MFLEAIEPRRDVITLDMLALLLPVVAQLVQEQMMLF